MCESLADLKFALLPVIILIFPSIRFMGKGRPCDCAAHQITDTKDELTLVQSEGRLFVFLPFKWTQLKNPHIHQLSFQSCTFWPHFLFQRQQQTLTRCDPDHVLHDELRLSCGKRPPVIDLLTVTQKRGESRDLTSVERPMCHEPRSSFKSSPFYMI